MCSSDLLVSCANYNVYSFLAGSLSAGNPLVDGGVGLSHRAKGLNAAMIDGSVRWISSTQVKAGGWQGGANSLAGYNSLTLKPDREAAYMFTQSNNGVFYRDNFHGWTRKFDPY